MIMTDDKQDRKLTQRSQQILDVLQDSGDWLSRSALADLLEQDRLYPWDVEMLDRLLDADLVENRKQPQPGIIPYYWEYRAK